MTDAQIVLNGKPELGREEGTALDWYVSGDLLFNEVPGLNQNEGLLYEWRTPSILQLREMLGRDGRARSLEQCLVMPVAGATWRLEGGDPDVAEWVDDVLRRDTLDGGMRSPMGDVIAQKAEAFIFRVSYHEKVWKEADGKVVYDKIGWRPPDACNQIRIKGPGDLGGFMQWVTGMDEDKRAEKQTQVPIHFPYADVYVHGARRDPVRGVCDLDVTYTNYRIKEKLKYLWWTYCEVLALPRYVILGTTVEDAKKVADAIASLKNAGVAGIDANWAKDKWEINVGAGGSSEFMDAISYLDSDSALSLMAGFSELPARAMGSGSSHGPLGSYALAESSQNFFTDLLASYVGEMSAQITNSIVADLVRYNFGVKTRVPKFVIDMEQAALNKSFDLLGRLLTSPVPTNVPFEFVKELTLTVAKELGMDVDTIAAGIKKQQEDLEKQAKSEAEAAKAPLQAAATVGAQVAQAGPVPPPAPVGTAVPPIVEEAGGATG